MLEAITSGVTSFVGMVGNVLSAIFGTAGTSGGIAGSWSSVLPAVGLAVGTFVTITSVGVVKSLIKGY